MFCFVLVWTKKKKISPEPFWLLLVVSLEERSFWRTVAFSLWPRGLHSLCCSVFLLWFAWLWGGQVPWGTTWCLPPQACLMATSGPCVWNTRTSAEAFLSGVCMLSLRKQRFSPDVFFQMSKICMLGWLVNCDPRSECKHAWLSVLFALWWTDDLSPSCPMAAGLGSSSLQPSIG